MKIGSKLYLYHQPISLSRFISSTSILFLVILCTTKLSYSYHFAPQSILRTSTTPIENPNLSPPQVQSDDPNASINSGPKPVRILVHPRNITALERKTAILVCEAESDPKPTFNWFKDGKPLLKKRLSIFGYPGGSVLRIDPIKNERDSGEYECQVENGIGPAVRSQIQVRAINETDAPQGFPKIVSQPLPSKLIEVGGVAILTCSATGDPEPEYSWFHESLPIHTQLDSSSGSNPKYTLENGILKVHNITENDKGEYLCTAGNNKGVVTSQTTSLMVSTEPLPEAAPIDLKVKLTSPTDVTLLWSPPEFKNNITITGYQLFFGKLGSPQSEKYDLPNITRFAKNDLSEDTKYAFRVRAKTRGVLGSYSETIDFSTPKDSPPPPTNVKALADSYSTAMVWWDETAYFSGVTGYRVYYNLHNQSTLQESYADDFDLWSTKNVSLTSSVIISNLLENRHYEVRVCAVGNDFSGKLSKPASFNTQPEEVPHDLKISDLTTHSVKVTWKPPLKMMPLKYKVVYDAPEKYYYDYKGERKTIKISPATLYSNNTFIVIDDLMPYTKYRINVTATSSKDTFRPPGMVHITTAMAAPKSMDKPARIGPLANGREFKLVLPQASEEYGPIGHYYVVVVPSEMPSSDPDSWSTQELTSPSVKTVNGPYIAAKFTRNRMIKDFILGDGKTYEGFINKPLIKDQQYCVFVRAVVDHSESLYTSSPLSDVITLAPPEARPSQTTTSGESFKMVRWVLFSALVLVIILALIVTAFYNKQRQALKTNQMNETTIRLLPDPMMNSIYAPVPIEHIERSRTNYQSRAKQNHPPVPVNELAEHIEVLKMDNNLKEEYESIEPGQQFTWDHSNMDCNRAKNRYGNVVSYDHSRVILSQIDGIPGSDYINANFCDGYNKPNQYIATQGPLPNTVGDFWRMVWEQKSSTIVMMTQLEERGRVKCVQYWPSHDSVSYHGITITALDVQELAYYSIRTFRLQCNNMLRDVRQFQFTAWPDHGVPDHPTPFLMFLRRIKIMNPPDAGPMIILCSAGVGRTGCFIVIDSMIERVKQESTIDIYGHVTKLRAQRNYIVQTEDQYMFIHDAILEAIIASDTEVPLAKLNEHYHKLMQVLPNEGSTGLELEFKRLALIKYSGQKFVSANLPINKHKNRLMNILPYESTRVCLEPIIGIEGSDYINASFCDGYRQRNAYIATQSPLPDTVEDLWRMMIEHQSSIIIMLTKLKEAGREKCTQYWPAERSGDYGPYKITLNHEYDNSLNYVLREFTVTDIRNPGCSRVFRQFHYTNWPEQVSLLPILSIILILFLRSSY